MHMTNLVIYIYLFSQSFDRTDPTDLFGQE